MAALTDAQRQHYETVRDFTRTELMELKEQIESELMKVKDRIAELQTAIGASKQMYAAACSRLGIENDLEDDDEG